MFNITVNRIFLKSVLGTKFQRTYFSWEIGAVRITYKQAFFDVCERRKNYQNVTWA